MKNNPSPQSLCYKHRAFSLVEVTLAIGIISFGLLAVIGLLPTGLRVIKNASEQAGAGATMTAISTALRNAVSQAGGTTFTGSFSGQEFTYEIGSGVGQTFEWNNLSLEGTDDSISRRLVARLTIHETPSLDGLTPGRASVSVAWSAASNPSYNVSDNRWQNAEGFLVMPIQFLPFARP